MSQKLSSLDRKRERERERVDLLKDFLMVLVPMAYFIKNYRLVIYKKIQIDEKIIASKN
jgi:hypothetical protein